MSSGPGTAAARVGRGGRAASAVVLAAALFAMTAVAPTRAAPPNTWERVPDLVTSHLGSAVALAGPRCGSNCGKVLVAANPFGNGWRSKDAELYDPQTNAWTSTAEMRLGGSAVNLTLLSGTGCGSNCGKVLSVGYALSADGSKDIPTAELYDPRPGAESWATAGAPPSLPSSGSTALFRAAPLLDGRVLVVDANGGASIFNSLTGSWAMAARTGSVHEGGFTATLIGGSACGTNCGKVLVAGGGTGTNGQGNATSELFDPVTGTWTRTPDLLTPREYASATQLPNGQVLLAGGFVLQNTGAEVPTVQTELFDPMQPPYGQWLPGPPMNVNRASHTADLTPCGVVIGGGYTRSAQGLLVVAPAGEIFFRNTSWTPTGPFVEARVEHGAAPLPDGGVLMVGGFYTDPRTRVDEGHLDTPRRSAERLTPPPCADPDVTLPTLPPTTLPPTTLPPGVTPPTVPRLPTTTTTTLPPGPPPPGGPAVTAVAPRSGPVAGDTFVTITGTDLDRATSVAFGGAPVTAHPCPTGGQQGQSPCFTEVSPSRITAYTPAAAGPGTVHVRVTNPIGTSAATPADLFEYTDAPAAPGRGEAPGQAALPGPPGGTSAIPAPPGGSPALGPAPGSAPAPGNAPAPGSAPAPGGASGVDTFSAGVPTLSAVPGGAALPMPGGPAAAHPGLAGVREQAPEAAPLLGVNMVRADPGAGAAGWFPTSAGIVTLLACGVGLAAVRREQARNTAAGAAGREAY